MEGDDASFAALSAPSRFGSYLQISSKTFLVSDSLEAVSKAGRSSELARGAMVKMRELKRDIETRICQNGISTVGGAGTGRGTGIGPGTGSGLGPGSGGGTGGGAYRPGSNGSQSNPGCPVGDQ